MPACTRFTAHESSLASGPLPRRARSLYLLGNIYGDGAPPTANQARESYQQALVLAHELGMPPLEAQCHFAFGKLAKKTGEQQGARAHFSTALSMFREMGMQFPREKAETALNNVSAQ